MKDERCEPNTVQVATLALASAAAACFGYQALNNLRKARQDRRRAREAEDVELGGDLAAMLEQLPREIPGLTPEQSDVVRRKLVNRARELVTEALAHSPPVHPRRPADEAVGVQRDSLNEAPPASHRESAMLDSHSLQVPHPPARGPETRPPTPVHSVHLLDSTEVPHPASSTQGTHPNEGGRQGGAATPSSGRGGSVKSTRQVQQPHSSRPSSSASRGGHQAGSSSGHHSGSG